MKKFWKSLAWIGTSLMLVSILFVLWLLLVRLTQPPSPYPTAGVLLEVFFVIPPVIFACLFMLLGGMIGRPKSYWIVSLVLGILYLGIFNAIYHGGYIRMSYTLPRHIEIFSPEILVLCVGPGLIAVGEGIFLAAMQRNQERSHQNPGRSPSPILHL
jgi:hypothetical protein